MSAPKTLSVLALTALVACEPTDAPELPDWSPGFPSSDTGGSTDTGGGDTGELSGLLALDVNMSPALTRFGQKADPSLDCEIDASTGTYTRLECQLEINELDLYFNGWNYDLTIPSGTCEYLGVENYMYKAWTHGTGPSTVTIQVNQDGSFYADGANAQDGEPFCEFDHTDPSNEEAPNCCFGTYSLIIETVDSTGNVVGTETVPGEEWGGGAVGDCYAGAAFSSSATQVDPVSGLPRYLIVDIDEDVDNVYNVSFNAPIAKPESSNVTVANFYDPADGTPAGLVEDFARDHYAIECLDRALEITARFEIDVREWDEKAEYLAEGDPNSGIQASAGATPPVEDNGSGSPLNDFWDWADFALNGIDYVGSDD